MKNVLLSLSILITMMSFIVCQESIDVIYLKNGDVVKGIIFENVYNDYVSIKLKDGYIFSFYYVEIERFSTETKETKETQSRETREPVRQTQVQLPYISVSQKTQFNQGTISAGSLFNYSSHTYNENDKATHYITMGTNTTSILNIKPTVSYFTQPNLSIDILIGLTIRTDQDEGDNRRFMLFGAGATYYTDNIYGGGGIMRNSYKRSNYNQISGNYLEFHGGYLYGLTDNVYLDLGVSYLSGIASSDHPDNEQTFLQLSVGIKTFFSLQ